MTDTWWCTLFFLTPIVITPDIHAGDRWWVFLTIWWSGGLFSGRNHCEKRTATDRQRAKQSCDFNTHTDYFYVTIKRTNKPKFTIFPFISKFKKKACNGKNYKLTNRLIHYDRKLWKICHRFVMLEHFSLNMCTICLTCPPPRKK